MICASLAPRTTEEAVEGLRRAAEEGADLAELRLDLMPPDADLDRILSNRPLPVIVTLRPKWEGGAYCGSEDGRILRLRAAARRGVEFLDIEFRAYKDLHDLAVKKILSYHDHAGVPSDPSGLLRKMGCLGPDGIKLAVTPKSTAEVLAVARLAGPASPPRCVIAMGELGEPLRILYRRLAMPMTYAALDADRKTAPGQLTVRELREIYRAHALDETTEVYALVGRPVSHSRGPEIWNRAFRELGRNAVYLRILLDEPSLLRELSRVLGVRGFSVTLPYKESVLDLLDEVDPVARRIGSVNTIAVREGRLFGTNTDWVGAMSAIRQAAKRVFGSEELRGKRALVFGAGGTARALVYGLTRAGCDVVVANRTRGRAERLAGEFRIRAVSLDEAGRLDRPDIVAQTTRVGMDPHRGDSVVPPALLGPGRIAFDAVYAPPETRFLRDARVAGAEIASGVEMFLYQAAAQFEVLTGEALPPRMVELWRSLLDSPPTRRCNTSSPRG